MAIDVDQRMPAKVVRSVIGAGRRCVARKVWNAWKARLARSRSYGKIDERARPVITDAR